MEFLEKGMALITSSGRRVEKQTNNQSPMKPIT